jgi:hypothetical protein
MSNDSYQSIEISVSDTEKWFRYSKITAGHIRDCAVYHFLTIDIRSQRNSIPTIYCGFSITNVS